MGDGRAATAAPTPGAANRAPAVAVATNGARVEDAQAAMNTRDYDKAARILVTLQRPATPLTPEQSQAIDNQMKQLQRSLASAAASGDPKARAAIEILRQSSAHR